MPDETTAEKAATAVDDALDTGQSSAQADVSVSKVNAAVAYDILKQESDRSAQKAGRRPLFRGLNLSGVG